jgi:hypothetical protein
MMHDGVRRLLQVCIPRCCVGLEHCVVGAQHTGDILHAVPDLQN